MSILPNFLCEYEMAGRDLSGSKIEKILKSRWDNILRLVPGWEDAGIVSAAKHATGPLLSWCDLSDHRGSCPRPIVVRSNDKRTSHHIERELDVALDAACVVENLQHLTRVASNFDGKWVLKHPFGVAGRERSLGRGSLEPQARSWAQDQFDDGWTLIFEPWVEKSDEFSLHFDLTEDGPIWIGSCRLLTHGDGTFRGVVAGVAAPAELREPGEAAAGALHDLGYRGPLGIDCLVGTLGGAQLWRPVVEMNARWSFGRLGLILRDRSGHALLEWHHTKRPDQAAPWDELQVGEPARLPEFCDPGGVSGSWVRVPRDTGIEA